jgi:DNA-binding MarR family transcriptional regulator/GNAT superfamily N-acetyltransferase
MSGNSPLVTDIRTASRNLARELSRMNLPLADTGLPPSAVHALLEIGAAGFLSAKALTDKLLLEKSTVSRLVKSLIAKGTLQEVRSDEDKRVKNLFLTEKGEKLRAAIAQYSEAQVTQALTPLPGPSQHHILTGLTSYAAALEARNDPDAPTTPPAGPPTLLEGYQPGIIGRVIEMHAAYYSTAVNFGAPFEAKVAAGLANFIPRLENPTNNIWCAVQNDQIIGSISIDSEDLGDGNAHLRWFIMDERAQGTGLGKHLLQKALDFCDTQAFPETHLWTFQGLNAARHLYETHGFTLTNEYKGDQWGAEVTEQVFVRELLNPY